MYEIVRASTLSNTPPQSKPNRYPWRKLDIDDAFIVPARIASENSLRVGASNAGKRLNRTFHVTKHKSGDFEVWRSA